MDLEEHSTILNLIEELAKNLWESEHAPDDKYQTGRPELPIKLKKKLTSIGFEILLKKHHLEPEITYGEEIPSLMLSLTELLKSKTKITDEDQPCFNDVTNQLYAIKQKFSDADSVYKFINLMKTSKPPKLLKANELFDFFHMSSGNLKHHLPLSKRFQTLQDQLASFENISEALFSKRLNPSFQNPFTITQFTNGDSYKRFPNLSLDIPQNIFNTNSTTLAIQDEGYVTPDSNNLLDDGTTLRPPFLYSNKTCNEARSWNRLENHQILQETTFMFDVVHSKKKPNNSECILKDFNYVLESAVDPSDLKDIQLFMYLKSDEEFLIDFKYLLMGLQSNCFKFDEDSKEFCLAFGVHTNDVSPSMLKTYVYKALKCGKNCYLLRNLPVDKNNGYIYKSFVRAILEYMRVYNDYAIYKDIDSSKYIDYLRLEEIIYTHYCQLNCLRKLCTPTLYRGAELLNHIYSYALETLFTNQHSLSLHFARILETCTNSYFELLQDWLFEGICRDPHKEFLISKSSLNQFRTRFFWTKGFHFNKKNCPVFLLDYEKELFSCGKNICLLKLTNPNDPFFSITPDLKPKLKFYITKESLEQFKIECGQYEEVVLKACGAPPDFAVLLRPEEHSHEQMMQYQEQARARRDEFIKKFNEEKLRKREIQAEKRRTLLKEIEEVELRRKEEKEKELEEDLRRLEEAKRMDKEYERIKQEEKRKIEDYYRSLMKIIEERQGVVLDKTKKLQTLKSYLKRKASRQSIDLTDGSPGAFPYNNEATPKTAINLTGPICTEPVLSELETVTELELSENELNIELEISDPPNIALLMNKIKEEEEAITLAQETQQKLDNLKASRSQAKMNKKKILSCEYNICTGEENNSNSPKVTHNYSTEPTDITVIENTAISKENTNETGGKRDSKHSVGTTQTEAMKIKNKILNLEYHIEIIPSEEIDGKRSDTSAENEIKDKKKVNEVIENTKVEKKVLSAHEEAKRNKMKVLHHEFDLSNKDKSVAKPLIETKCTAINDDKENTELIDEIIVSNNLEENQTNTHNDLEIETTQSVTSSSENLITIISNENKYSDIVERSSSDTEKDSEQVDTFSNTKGECSYINATFHANSNSFVNNNEMNYNLRTLIKDEDTLDITDVRINLQQSITVPLSIQYKLTNNIILKLFLEKYQLANHLISLRNYFFLLDGSFSKSLTNDISKQIKNNIILLLKNPFKLNNILNKAINYSTYDNKLKYNYYFSIKNISTSDILTQGNVFDYITLCYKVEWPLNILITPEALTNYDKVFIFLMQVQQVSCTLKEVFSYLKLHRSKGDTNPYVYRQIQLFRHVMTQVISALHSYIHGSVLEIPWQEMLEAFRKPVTLDFIYYRHVEYVKQILFRCLLNKRSRVLAQSLRELFNTVLLFYEELKKRPFVTNYENLAAIFKKFLEITIYLHDYIKIMSNAGYQEQHLDYLLHMLSLNNYFTKH